MEGEDPSGIRVERLSDAGGASITGVDLSAPPCLRLKSRLCTTLFSNTA